MLLVSTATREKLLLLLVAFSATRVKLSLLLLVFTATRVKLLLLLVAFTATRIKLLLLLVAFTATRVKLSLQSSTFCGCKSESAAENHVHFAETKVCSRNSRIVAATTNDNQQYNEPRRQQLGYSSVSELWRLFVVEGSY